MKRRPTKSTIRNRASGPSSVSKRDWKYCGEKIPVSGVQLTYKLVSGKRTRVLVKTDENPMVYVGPTIEGPDAEFIKVVSGKVDVRKPSFVK